MSWIANVIRRTAAREGSYASLNLNSDGAGLSFGILQWTQASGNLGKLLATMYGMDPAAFVAIFGSLWQALLAATADVAGDNIAEARKRLAGAVEQCYARAREGATAGTEAVDTAIRANPYPSIIAGVGLGAVLGYLIASRGTCHRA